MREYPPILTGSTEQRINVLRDYLVRQCRREALAESKREESRTALSQTSAGPTVSDGGDNDSSLRALIVKTAGIVEENMDRLRLELRGDYLAISDFGEYQESIRSLIQASARQIVESYQFDSRLRAAESAAGELREQVTSLEGEIRRGILTDPETGEIAFGIAIGEKLSFTGESVVRDGESYERLAPGQSLALYTAQGWQYWINGSKRGWFDAADGQLHVRNLRAEEGLSLGGDWLITQAGGFGIRYTGGGENVEL